MRSKGGHLHPPGTTIVDRGGGLRHQLAAIYNAVLKSLPRDFIPHSHLDPCDLNDSHNGKVGPCLAENSHLVSCRPKNSQGWLGGSAALWITSKVTASVKVKYPGLSSPLKKPFRQVFRFLQDLWQKEGLLPSSQALQTAITWTDRMTLRSFIGLSLPYVTLHGSTHCPHMKKVSGLNLPAGWCLPFWVEFVCSPCMCVFMLLSACVYSLHGLHLPPKTWWLLYVWVWAWMIICLRVSPVMDF